MHAFEIHTHDDALQSAFPLAICDRSSFFFIGGRFVYFSFLFPLGRLRDGSTTMRPSHRVITTRIVQLVNRTNKSEERLLMVRTVQGGGTHRRKLGVWHSFIYLSNTMITQGITRLRQASKLRLIHMRNLPQAVGLYSRVVTGAASARL